MKMVKLTLKELRSIAKIRNVTDCKSISKNQLTYLLIKPIKEFKEIIGKRVKRLYILQLR